MSSPPGNAETSDRVRCVRQVVAQSIAEPRVRRIHHVTDHVDDPSAGIVVVGRDRRERGRLLGGDRQDALHLGEAPFRHDRGRGDACGDAFPRQLALSVEVVSESPQPGLVSVEPVRGVGPLQRADVSQEL